MNSDCIQQLARMVVRHSLRTEPGERVLVEVVGDALPLVQSLIREISGAGATPFVSMKHESLLRELALHQSAEDLTLVSEAEVAVLRKMNAFIGIRADANCHELADLPVACRQRLFQHYIKPVHVDYRNNHLRRVLLRWPTASAAQEARMSTNAFTDMYTKMCLLDYERFNTAVSPLVDLLEQTDEVRLVGLGGTDLRLSVAGMSVKAMCGQLNIPDGEVQTAPVLCSVNGRALFNVPSTYMGLYFYEVGLEFEDGRVADVFGRCDHDQLWSILRQDSGSSHIGEFAIGVNPFLNQPVGDLLFDEKMWGSVHLALGASRGETDNGNRSAIHWDLVLLQTPQGGRG